MTQGMVYMGPQYEHRQLFEGTSLVFHQQTMADGVYMDPYMDTDDYMGRLINVPPTDKMVTQ